MRQDAKFIIAALAAAGSLALVGCDVKKTQEGHVQVPKYDISKKQEGDVQLPKYQVTTPDVNVGKTEKEVTVPKVTTEKETITVPKVDITTAKEKEQAQAAAGSDEKVAKKK